MLSFFDVFSADSLKGLMVKGVSLAQGSEDGDQEAMSSTDPIKKLLNGLGTNRRKLVIQSWAAGSTPKAVESSTRVAVHDHLDAWKAMQNLFSCHDNFLV